MHKPAEGEISWKCKLYKACHRSNSTILIINGVFITEEKVKEVVKI
jgi:hypothetical protein